MSHKGRCFRDRRKTKARKERQRQERRAIAAAKRKKFGYSEREKRIGYLPDHMTGPALAAAAASLLIPQTTFRHITPRKWS